MIHCGSPKIPLTGFAHHFPLNHVGGLFQNSFLHPAALTLPNLNRNRRISHFCNCNYTKQRELVARAKMTRSYGGDLWSGNFGAIFGPYRMRFFISKSFMNLNIKSVIHLNSLKASIVFGKKSQLFKWLILDSPIRLVHICFRKVFLHENSQSCQRL